MISNPKIQKLVNLYHENKFSHAFLFVTNDIVQCNKDIKELIKQISCPHNYQKNCLEECNLCYQIEKESLPNIMQIYPDGATIKKEQILTIKEQFKSKPLYIKNNFYIINNAEKLNSSSANTMLKFLEEPEDNIIGFFLTTNKEQIIETIKSRCQKIIVTYEQQDITNKLNLDVETEELIISVSSEYLYKLLLDKQDGIILNKLLLVPNIENRNILNVFLSYWYYIIENILNNKEIDNNFNFLKDLSFVQLKEINKIIFKKMINISYNANIELLLDEFVMEVEKII